MFTWYSTSAFFGHRLVLLLIHLSDRCVFVVFHAMRARRAKFLFSFREGDSSTFCHLFSPAHSARYTPQSLYARSTIYSCLCAHLARALPNVSGFRRQPMPITHKTPSGTTTHKIDISRTPNVIIAQPMKIESKMASTKEIIPTMYTSRLQFSSRLIYAQ